MKLPEQLEINAWSGAGATVQEVSAETVRWGARIEPGVGGQLPPEAADLWDWRHPRIGWGLVLADDPGLDRGAAARAEDAPEPIRHLAEARAVHSPGGEMPVFRWRASDSPTHLRRVYSDGSEELVTLIGGPRGTARGALPRYLLIYGSPADVPWRVHYRLQAVAYVGRLDLTGDGLARYIEALLGEWSDSSADPASAVVWGVDHGADDITLLMRRSIAEPVAARIVSDALLSATYLGSGDELVPAGAATAVGLTQALGERRPAFVVTTSHGLTAPLDDPPAMGRRVGVPVDVNDVALDPSAITSDGLVDGCVWYAHACCSAGTDAESAFTSAVPAGGKVHRTLEAIAAVGSRIAPFAGQILGAQRPARALIGHVEPTFDWTLRHRHTGQLLTHSTVEALYDRLYLCRPVGWTLERCHRHGLELELMHRQAAERFDAGQDTRAEMLAARLTAQDRQSLVVIGDPTVTLPSLA